MAGVDLREELRRGLRRHPRVALQGLFEGPDARERLAGLLPNFVPFKGAHYAGVLWVLDWDHRLPSRDLILRLYAFYSDEARRAGIKTFDERQAQISREELFPEFDVPDFAGLPADEAYEAEMPASEPPKKFRLVSEWRREVDPRLARKAEEIVRASHPFQELASQMRTRPPGLGDLEAAEWAPPSESGHERWGIDVWYLRSFNGMVGEGTAFLVDLEREHVISQRDFQFPSRMKLALVCLGGAIGSGARYLLSGWVAAAAGPGLPWGTWAVNVIGCFLIELVMQAAVRAGLSPMAMLTLTTGFLGGFTTYSAFNNQMLELLRTGGWGGAAYLAATLVGCLVAGLAGLTLGQAIWSR